MRISQSRMSPRSIHGYCGLTTKFLIPAPPFKIIPRPGQTQSERMSLLVSTRTRPIISSIPFTPLSEKNQTHSAVPNDRKSDLGSSHNKNASDLSTHHQHLLSRINIAVNERSADYACRKESPSNQEPRNNAFFSPPFLSSLYHAVRLAFAKMCGNLLKEISPWCCGQDRGINACPNDLPCS